MPGRPSPPGAIGRVGGRHGAATSRHSPASRRNDPDAYQRCDFLARLYIVKSSARSVRLETSACSPFQQSSANGSARRNFTPHSFSPEGTSTTAVPSSTRTFAPPKHCTSVPSAGNSVRDSAAASASGATSTIGNIRFICGAIVPKASRGNNTRKCSRPECYGSR